MQTQQKPLNTLSIIMLLINTKQFQNRYNQQINKQSHSKQIRQKTNKIKQINNQMDWIQILQLSDKTQRKQLSILRKWKKFTLYDNNSTITYNQPQQSFTCVFNCKKITSHHSIIGKIHIDLKANTITITNRLTDHQTLMGSKWQYQKIELTRFAFRYNERSHNNILIKVNPVNGQVAVCMSFLLTPGLFENEHHFKEIMTDHCQSLGEQAERIFNTMLQIIYQRQGNQPYLKSGVKVNPNFPRYMRVQKLLDKVKSLISTSSFYKIRVDTSSAHKNRSYFKKIYLTNQKRYIKQEQIQKLALVYELKYNKIYEQNVRKLARQKAKDYIKDYAQLQEKNEVEFAKHLNQSQVYDQPAFNKLSITQVIDPLMDTYQASQRKKIIKTSTMQQLHVLVDNFLPSQNDHTYSILKKLQFNHPNITKYYIDEKYPLVRITEGYSSLLLEEFMSRNKNTISLSTKFDLMAQLAQALQFMHKRFVGCFVKPEHVIIDEHRRVKLRSLTHAYAVSDKTGWRDSKSPNDSSSNQQQFKLQVDYQQSHIDFPFINISASNQDSSNKSKSEPKKCAQNEKCDVFSLGMVLYRILMDKYPFFVQSILQEIQKMSVEEYNRNWKRIWTGQTEYYLSQGGQIVRLVAHLLLRCFNSADVGSRPYVEWLSVILSQIKTSLNGLY